MEQPSGGHPNQRIATGMQKLTIIFFALIWCSTASANCLEAWGLNQRPEITCVPLTESLLVRLEGVTKAELIRAMKSPGITKVDNGRTILHFVSAADRLSGDMNFGLTGDRVTLIFGIVDEGMQFIWNPSYHGDLPSICSDLPNSRYVKCGQK